VRGGRGLYGSVGVDEGLGYEPNRREVRGGHVRARRVCPELLGKDDRWGSGVGD
jgi:hypothetical protein